jgi:hypothetical protein
MINNNSSIGEGEDDSTVTIDADQELQHGFKAKSATPLMKFNMDITQLTEFLNNIIQVVNQHAKLLHTLNKEVMNRTTEK